jgi:acyl dehydratase
MENKVTIPADMQACIGKTKVDSNPDELGKGAIKRFAIAIGDSNPIYSDEKCAAATDNKGIVAPPTMIFEINHNIYEELSEKDGGHKHFFHVPPTFKPVFYRGGNEYEFYRPVRPEDKITVKQEFEGISAKEAKTATLYFIVIKISYTNQNGELLGVNRETWILPSTSRIS